MTNQIETEGIERTDNSPEEENTKPLLRIAREILEYRLSTCNQCPSSYAMYQRDQIAALDKEIEEENPGYFRNGIHHEALFFAALNQRYSANPPYQTPRILFSTGNEDQRGIDFILQTRNRNFRIDVTINPEAYPKKLRAHHALPLLLPMIDPETEKNFLNYFRTYLFDNDLEDFLRETFWLNTYILNNKHKNYSIWVKQKGRKKNKPCSARYTEKSIVEIPHYREEHQIVISKRKRQLMLNLLSVIKNPTA
jgi:hypothetical protein